MKNLLKTILFLIFIVACLLIYQKYNQINDEKFLNGIKSHYNTYVITEKLSNLYNENKEVIGKVGNNVNLELVQTEITKDTKYFKIKDLNYYIDYRAVKPSIEFINDTRYKKYIVFNENVVTNEITNFYNDLGLDYTINSSLSLPIIIKDNDKYYVEYNNQLLYVNKDDVEEIIEVDNTIEATRKDIRTLAYHFVFKEGDECTNDYICHPEDQFISHMKYLSENKYFTLTMKELELFLDNKIRIPQKSIAITLDDGHLAKNAIEILDKYQINATYFLVTSWIDINEFKTNYVEFASHTDNMHNNYKCPGGNQGGQILCEDREVIIQDLKISREKLNNTEVFCFPFYDYNDYSINILKEVGFKMAFIGASNTEGLANHLTDKFKIPRMTLSAYTTMEDFISLLK